MKVFGLFLIKVRLLHVQLYAHSNGTADYQFSGFSPHNETRLSGPLPLTHAQDRRPESMNTYRSPYAPLSGTWVYQFSGFPPRYEPRLSGPPPLTHAQDRRPESNLDQALARMFVSWRLPKDHLEESAAFTEAIQFLDVFKA
jgi:hypothetical protein